MITVLPDSRNQLLGHLDGGWRKSRQPGLDNDLHRTLTPHCRDYSPSNTRVLVPHGRPSLHAHLQTSKRNVPVQGNHCRRRPKRHHHSSCTPPRRHRLCRPRATPKCLRGHGGQSGFESAKPPSLPPTRNIRSVHTSWSTPSSPLPELQPHEQVLHAHSFLESHSRQVCPLHCSSKVLGLTAHTATALLSSSSTELSC